MKQEYNEKKLISLAQSGDKSALGTLYQAHVAKIYRYILHRVPTTDAEDLTAEVFVNMVESLQRYTYTGVPFEAWLYQIARARIADYHRKHERRPVTEIDESQADETVLPEEKLWQEQELAQVREALKSLSEDDQQILILRFVERRSHDEVALIMDKSKAAVRTAQHRALTRLAQALDTE
ncbi:MAG: sigma-70 family RNA polymerase sigma factor, partial [Chloroflexota bacterium]